MARQDFEGNMSFVVHLVLSGVIGWLGFVFSLPGDTLASPAFIGFARRGDEEFWKILFVTSMCLGLIGAGVHSRVLRLGSIFFLASMHGIVAALFFEANPRGTATGTYGLYAVLGYALLFFSLRGAHKQ